MKSCNRGTKIFGPECAKNILTGWKMHASKQTSDTSSRASEWHKPVAITILDSEGYVTSRERRMEAQVAYNDPECLLVVDTVKSFILADVPPPPDVNTHLHPVPDRDCALILLDKLQSDKEEQESRLDFFQTELTKRNEECKHFKRIAERNTAAISQMKHNHTYEVRLLQKAILNLQQRDRKKASPETEMLEQYTKNIVERDTLLKERNKLESELFDLKMNTNNILSERNRIAKQYNALVDQKDGKSRKTRGPTSPSATASFDEQLRFFEARLLSNPNARDTGVSPSNAPELRLVHGTAVCFEPARGIPIPTQSDVTESMDCFVSARRPDLAMISHIAQVDLPTLAPLTPPVCVSRKSQTDKADPSRMSTETFSASIDSSSATEYFRAAGDFDEESEDLVGVIVETVLAKALSERAKKTKFCRSSTSGIGIMG